MGLLLAASTYLGFSEEVGEVKVRCGELPVDPSIPPW
jgi:hypothetical protein